MLAYAFLTVATAIERDHSPAQDGQIELTVNEFRRLFDALLLNVHHTITTLLAWSTWRRKHQARARDCHYRRREPNTMITIYGCSTSWLMNTAEAGSLRLDSELTAFDH